MRLDHGATGTCPGCVAPWWHRRDGHICFRARFSSFGMSCALKVPLSQIMRQGGLFAVTTFPGPPGDSYREIPSPPVPSFGGSGMAAKPILDLVKDQPLSISIFSIRRAALPVLDHKCGQSSESRIWRCETQAFALGSSFDICGAYLGTPQRRLFRHRTRVTSH